MTTACCIDGHVLASGRSRDSRWANYDEGCSLGLRTGPEQHGNALTAAVPRKAGKPAAQITIILGAMAQAFSSVHVSNSMQYQEQLDHIDRYH